MGYHRLLERLIRRHLKNTAGIPEEFEPIFQAISESYVHNEADRNMLERSLEISSQELNNANTKIREALKEIEEKNKDIMDSINYARRIQQAILPNEEIFKAALPDSFVLFKPKDIVSGDFYWLCQVEHKVFYTAADCTGHGVPGAFMSMIGTALLNEAVNEKGISMPNDVLNEVRNGIIRALKQKGESGEQKDGMDAALCMLDTKSKKLAYSGANNPLFIIRNGGKELTEEISGTTKSPFLEEDGLSFYDIKPDKQPVGLYSDVVLPFSNSVFQLQEGDLVYTFSDGYVDQFGGPNSKKFKSKQFKRLLFSICKQPMAMQKQLLNETLEEWKGDLEQLDDICVIGVRV